ncbi:MAG: hypothetical protein JWQ04_2983 [Pedosphaera sp.]|nr:hypothetical protein [Pedosphaera sp.]
MVGEFLVHRAGTQINSAGPFHTAKIRVHDHGIEHVWLKQLQKHTAASLRLDRKNTIYAIRKGDVQSVSWQRLGRNDPNHNTILLQRRNFGRRLIGAGQFPCLSQFRPMQCGPFENERHCAAAHLPFNDFKRFNAHLNFLILVNGMKVRRCMIAIKHANDNAVKSAEFGHSPKSPQKRRMHRFHRLFAFGQFDDD